MVEVVVVGSVWDEVLDTEHALVVRAYVEAWPRKEGPPEKVLVIVVEPDAKTRQRCPHCRVRGKVELPRCDGQGWCGVGQATRSAG